MKSLILGLLLVSGCVSGSVVEPRVCSSATLTFPGAPFVNPGIQLPPVTQSLTPDVGFDKDIITKVLLIDGAITRADGGNFDFVDEIMISIASPNGGQDLVVLDSQHNSGTTLPVMASDKNLIDYIDHNNKLTVNVTINSQNPPANSWDLKAELCVSAEADKTYSF